MKKLLFLIVAAVLPVVMSAQNKGDMYISGSLGIDGGNKSSSVSLGGTKTTTKAPAAFSFQIEPSFGYFVIDRLEVNLALGYDLAKSTPNQYSTANDNLFDFTNLFTIAPGVSYYIPICDKFWYVPGVALSVGFGNYKTQVAVNATEKRNLTTFGIGVSLLSFEFRPCEHLGIRFSAGDLSYKLSHTKYDASQNGNTATYTVNSNSVGLGINLGTTIGFKYYF